MNFRLALRTGEKIIVMRGRRDGGAGASCEDLPQNTACIARTDRNLRPGAGADTHA